MKTLKFIVFISLLILPFSGIIAQDTLFMKDGNIIPTKVLEVGPEEVKYKRSDNIDRPVFISKKSDVRSVKYENGATEEWTLKEPKVVSAPVDLNVPIYRKGMFYKQGNYKMKEKKCTRSY